MELIYLWRPKGSHKIFMLTGKPKSIKDMVIPWEGFIYESNL